MAPLGPYAKRVCYECDAYVAVTKAGTLMKHTCSSTVLTCSMCKQTKDASFFFAANDRPRGHVARCRSCSSEVQRSTRKRTPWRREQECQRNAKVRSLEWSLTKDQFMAFWDQPCGYCGEKVDGIGLDRIDNSAGYTLLNVIACCQYCNAMKSNMSHTEFITRCRMVANQAIACDGR